MINHVSHLNSFYLDTHNLPTKTAAIILAAGGSSRFGTCKLLSTINGKSLLQHSIDAANTYMNGHVYVVTGAHHSEIMDHLEIAEISEIDHPYTSHQVSYAKLYGGCTPIFNMNWKRGQGSSLATAVSILKESYKRLLILQPDQYSITARHIQQLLSSYKQGDIVCSFYSQHRNLPALFRKSEFEQLEQLETCEDIVHYLHTTTHRHKEIALPDGMIDINTIEDLEHARLGAKLDISPVALPNLEAT